MSETLPGRGAEDHPANAFLNGQKYTATAMHGTEEGRSKHEEMGFHQGWGAALDQLVTLAKTL